MHTAKGYQLAPAYDLVASMTIGEHHAAGFADQPYPPTISEAEKMGRIFGLPKDAVSATAQQVRESIERLLLKRITCLHRRCVEVNKSQNKQQKQ